jgi:hypothetical protein
MSDEEWIESGQVFLWDPTSVFLWDPTSVFLFCFFGVCGGTVGVGGHNVKIELQSRGAGRASSN